MIKKILNKLNIRGEIWCLHRVTPLRSRFTNNRELQITPEFFSDLIDSYFNNGYSFVNLDYIILNKNKPFVLCSKYVSISFDDGFRDIYDFAYPILKQKNIPFTLFLTTGMPDNTTNLWWEQLEYTCANDKQFNDCFKKIIDSKINMPDAFDGLCGSSIGQRKFTLTKKLSLSWEQIREMLDSGLLTLGSHTVSHPGLTRIADRDIGQELTESKNRIFQETGVQVKYFSYPHSMVNDSVIKIVKNCGFSFAFLGYGGKISYKDNNFRLNRKYIIQPDK